MKRIGGLLLAGLLVLLSPVQAAEISVSAKAAILYDCDTGRTLYEKNADEQRLIASTTKIMTAVVALERARLDDVVTVTQAHMVEGSSMYLKPGQTVSVEKLLYGLMLCSGNDAALCLADHCGDGVENFVALMNDKARTLGMTNTSFENPNGLDGQQHYSTARDMALLAAYAAEDPTFRRICSSKSATVDGRTMENHNRLLKELEGCIGMKTGYTKAAGRTLVTVCERDGRRLAAVTLHDGNDWADHKALYTWGFKQVWNEYKN